MIGSNIVRAETWSLVAGSNKITSPLALPMGCQSNIGNASDLSLPKATFPFLIQCATSRDSYDTNRANCSPVNKSHTIAVCPASYVTTSLPAPVSLTLSAEIN